MVYNAVRLCFLVVVIFVTGFFHGNKSTQLNFEYVYHRAPVLHLPKVTEVVNSLTSFKFGPPMSVSPMSFHSVISTMIHSHIEVKKTL